MVFFDFAREYKSVYYYYYDYICLIVEQLEKVALFTTLGLFPNEFSAHLGTLHMHFCFRLYQLGHALLHFRLQNQSSVFTGCKPGREIG